MDSEQKNAIELLDAVEMENHQKYWPDHIVNPFIHWPYKNKKWYCLAILPVSKSSHAYCYTANHFKNRTCGNCGALSPAAEVENIINKRKEFGLRELTREEIVQAVNEQSYRHLISTTTKKED